MSYISGIFERANIQQLREFLLNGVDLIEFEDKSYEQRINEDLDKALKSIRLNLSKNSLISAVSTYGDVYMEIGLQIGIILATQFFNLQL